MISSSSRISSLEQFRLSRVNFPQITFSIPRHGFLFLGRCARAESIRWSRIEPSKFLIRRMPGDHLLLMLLFLIELIEFILRRRFLIEHRLMIILSIIDNKTTPWSL